MPEIKITATQQDRLEEVRVDVEAAFVDEYGHTRLRDAVQYLLDTYTPPGDRETATVDAYDRIATAEYPTLQQIAADVPDVPGSGIEADEMRGRLLRELGPAEFAARLEGVTADGVPNDEGGTDETGTESGSSTSTESTTNEDGTDTQSVTASGPTKADESADSGGLLSRANKLLDEYSDVWRENDDGDEPYAVDLPDGTTERVRTKDDVRRLLFQHYD